MELASVDVYPWPSQDAVQTSSFRPEQSGLFAFIHPIVEWRTRLSLMSPSCGMPFGHSCPQTRSVSNPSCMALVRPPSLPECEQRIFRAVERKWSLSALVHKLFPSSQQPSSHGLQSCGLPTLKFVHLKVPISPRAWCGGSLLLTLPPLFPGTMSAYHQLSSPPTPITSTGPRVSLANLFSRTD